MARGGSPAGPLLPSVRVLSRLFRRLFLVRLLGALGAGCLQFFGNHFRHRPSCLHCLSGAIASRRMGRYSKRPPEFSSKGGRPEAVLVYL